MKIIKKEQRTFIERLYCDCGGEADNARTVITTFPVQYFYHCKLCGEKIVTSDIYPKVTYVEI